MCNSAHGTPINERHHDIWVEAIPATVPFGNAIQNVEIKETADYFLNRIAMIGSSRHWPWLVSFLGLDLFSPGPMQFAPRHWFVAFGSNSVVVVIARDRLEARPDLCAFGIQGRC